jgi:hypothetical protein
VRASAKNRGQFAALFAKLHMEAVAISSACVKMLRPNSQKPPRTRHDCRLVSNLRWGWRMEKQMSQQNQQNQNQQKPGQQSQQGGQSKPGQQQQQSQPGQQHQQGGQQQQQKR